MRLRGMVAGVVGALASMAMACKGDASESDVLASEVIGPDGGTVQGGGLTLRVPERAVTADTTFEIRRASEPLGARDYVQRGNTYALVPEGLLLRLPAELELDGDPPAVLFMQDGLVVAAEGSIAYLNELSLVTRAEAGTPLVTIADPVLAASPNGDLTTHRDVVHATLNFGDLAALPRLNLALTLYDSAGAYTRPLNGSAEGDCGFQLENVIGGSLAASCAEGPLTAAIRVTNAELAFDAVPFLSGKLDTPVTVGVVAGGDDLAHQLGFFAFDTSSCFQETCSGHGTCEPGASGGTCQCDEGFARPSDEEPLVCACAPRCDGRACGGDGCGGSCGDCGGGAYCDDGPGVCVPVNDDDTNTASDSDSDSAESTTSTTTSTDDGTTTTSDETTGGGDEESTGSTSG